MCRVLSGTENFSRTFYVHNRGNMDVSVKRLVSPCVCVCLSVALSSIVLTPLLQSIDKSGCELYGFKLQPCLAPMEHVLLPPQAAMEFNITFTPDYSLSRIRLPLIVDTDQVCHPCTTFFSQAHADSLHTGLQHHSNCDEFSR